MVQVTKAAARAYFETGDRPTQAQFADVVDSAAWGNGTATGVVEIESTNSSTILARGSFGRVILAAAATASALGHLGITSVGAVGNELIGAIATASALNQLGITSVGAVGNQLLSTIATASALNQLGITSVGAVGNQLLSAIATASAQNQLALGTANDVTFNRVIVTDGSAAAPAITFSGDTNMGLYRIGTDNMAVAMAGARVMDFSAAGEITAPLQPAFLAYNSVDDASATGNGATVTVDFDTEDFDQGGDFATDTFTAPITGRYWLSATVAMGNFAAGANTANLIIATSNFSFRKQKYTLPVTNTGDSVTLAVLARMEAADTATVTIQVAGMAGDTVAIQGGSAPMETYFSGSLAA